MHFEHLPLSAALRAALDDGNSRDLALDEVIKKVVKEGFLLYGNHRHACKELMRLNFPKKYEQNSPFWNGT